MKQILRVMTIDIFQKSIQALFTLKIYNTLLAESPWTNVQ